MPTHVAGATVHRHHSLTEGQIAAVRALAGRCAEADGVGPLNEEAELGLQADDRRHVLLDDGAVGYATIADGTVQLMVDPVRRRAGLGAGLAEAIVAPLDSARGSVDSARGSVDSARGSVDSARGSVDSARGSVDSARGTVRGWWAFGDLPGARALAARLGLAPTRVLLKLGRPLSGLPTPRTLPDHARLRAFEPGRDEESWLAVNARAFASHPEQGRMTRADLAARMAEDWFDPAGLLLAVAADDPDRVLGFHWTKITPEDATTGEVYVLGVDPGSAGGGLGGALLDAGLAHLVAHGADTVDLYVEGDNDAALRLYQRADFAELNRDVMYGEEHA